MRAVASLIFRQHMCLRIPRICSTMLGWCQVSPKQPHAWEQPFCLKHFHKNYQPFHFRAEVPRLAAEWQLKPGSTTPGHLKEGSPCAVGMSILLHSAGVSKACFCQGVAVLPLALPRRRGRQWRRLESAHAAAACIPVMPVQPQFLSAMCHTEISHAQGPVNQCYKLENLSSATVFCQVQHDDSIDIKKGVAWLHDTCQGGGGAGGRGHRPGQRWRVGSHRRLPTSSSAAETTRAHCPGGTQSPAASLPPRTLAPCMRITSLIGRHSR